MPLWQRRLNDWLKTGILLMWWALEGPTPVMCQSLSCRIGHQSRCKLLANYPRSRHLPWLKFLWHGCPWRRCCTQRFFADAFGLVSRGLKKRYAAMEARKALPGTRVDPGQAQQLCFHTQSPAWVWVWHESQGSFKPEVKPSCLIIAFGIPD